MKIFSRRRSILQKIKKKKSQLKNNTPLPSIPSFLLKPNSAITLKSFTEKLKNAHAQVIKIKNLNKVKKEIAALKIKPNQLMSQSQKLKTIIPLTTINSSQQISQFPWGIVDGEIGVEENGAIWINLDKLVNSTLPFLVENLIIFFDKKKLVKNMHQAYFQLKKQNKKMQNGVFIAGPSKTGDIEHNLVIGAHGARKVIVLIQ